ncbi:MAG: alpha-2-macroglobulin family protein, partial [Hyphomicrobiaceae bacterium]
PPTGKPVALFSGLVTTDASGKASVTFDLPEFNGTLRVMAVAWSSTKVGHGSVDVIVRDPVALLVSGPRFLTLGDTSRLQFDLHNIEGPASEYSLAVTREEGTTDAISVLDRKVTIKAGERIFVSAPISATDLCQITHNVRLTGSNNIDVARSLTFDVKTPGGAIRRRTVATLQPGESLKVTPDLIDGLIPGLARVSVSVGQAAGFDVPGMMLALERYPYACAEQTTSRALPLLYLSSIAGRTQGVKTANIKDRIQKAVARLMELQGSTGAFGLWSPGSSDMWLTAYVTDFLTRAKEQGHAVPKRALGQSLDRLQNFVTYAGDFKSGGEAVAYSLYVLARNGRAPIGDLRYYADTRLENFSTPLAKAQLGAALAMYGDTERAKSILRTASAALNAKADNRWRVDFGTSLRDAAGALTLISETGVGDQSVPTLTSMVASALASRAYTSTQENAWVLLAARSVMDNDKATRISVDGAQQTGHFTRDFTAPGLAKGASTIVNQGSAPVEAVVTVTGDALTPEPPQANGLKIERSFYTFDGKPIDLASGISGGQSTLQQNDRMVVVVKVDESMVKGGRFMVVDNLPAGLEVENPRLVAGGETGALAWLKTGMTPTHTEFRKDRVMAAFDAPLRNNQAVAKTMTVAYIVRAVSPGSFVHPAATVEDMYRPERFARTAAGRLDVETVR